MSNTLEKIYEADAGDSMLAIMPEIILYK